MFLFMWSFGTRLRGCGQLISHFFGWARIGLPLRGLMVDNRIGGDEEYVVYGPVLLTWRLMGLSNYV